MEQGLYFEPKTNKVEITLWGKTHPKGFWLKRFIQEYDIPKGVWCLYASVDDIGSGEVPECDEHEILVDMVSDFFKGKSTPDIDMLLPRIKEQIEIKRSTNE